MIRRREAWHYSALLVVFLAAGLGTVACRGKSSSAPGKDSFHRCRDMVTQGRYEQGQTCLRSHLADYPNSSFAGRAGLFLGKAELALGHFDKARAAWQSVRDRFPATLEGHKVRYKLALLHLIEGHRDEAMREFQAMADAPDGPLAPEAGAMAASLRAR